MSIGTVFTVAEKLYAVLRSREFNELCEIIGYQSQLEELADTVCTIKAVFLDADSKHQELRNEGQHYIERLKDSVYDVDDLLDEFNTLAQKKKREGGKLSKKVRRFFSRSNKFLVAYNMSHEIKKLRAKLDKIAKDHQQFGFSTDALHVNETIMSKKESASYASEDSIIGREMDKGAIVDMLLTDADECVSFVSIVGMGGLGKTALAQLVYNDATIKDAFKVENMLWVCVSDEFGLEQIFSKIVGKQTGIRMEDLQREVRKKIEGNRFLIILDDVWDENRNKWVELRDFLKLGANGSKVLVTSRSLKVARAIDDSFIYELKGLSDENSWGLFERYAFEQGKAPTNDTELVSIGKEVTKKCGNVPLAIKIIGNLLYKQKKSKWMSFINTDLRMFEKTSEGGQAEDSTMAILKYSYYHLTPSLKSCFSYCALFPKNYTIVKRDLIWLWMAQGCLVLYDDGRSIEEVGEDYFSILLQRSFFLGIEEDVYGEVYSVKMHDLIHDLAQEISGNELMPWGATIGRSHKHVRHFSCGRERRKLVNVDNYNSYKEDMMSMKMLRTFIYVDDSTMFPPYDDSYMTTFVSNQRSLRMLQLRDFCITSMPRVLGNLLHLRSLDLSSHQNLEILPESVTELHNLQVLNLAKTGVKELPKELRKLVNLRHLELSGCDKLTHMPAGMGSMTSLQTLSVFVVGAKTSTVEQMGQLNDMKKLVNLQGDLRIVFKKGCHYDVAGSVGLLSTISLKYLHLEWEEFEIECDCQAVHETLLEALKPCSDLMRIEIMGYSGIIMPTWAASLKLSFPNLVKVAISGCFGLNDLPSLGQLVHLKVLHLAFIPNVEFIENDISAFPVATTSYFSSLEELELFYLLKLKRVFKDNLADEEMQILPFPRLKKLQICGCPNMTVFPLCTSLKSVKLSGLNKDLRFSCAEGNPTISVEDVDVDDVGLINRLFGESVHGIRELRIREFGEENIEAALELFRKQAPSLRILILVCSSNLKKLSGAGLEHLTNLQYLRINGGENSELEEDGSVPWKSLHSLIQLGLDGFPKVVKLPQGLQHLTSVTGLFLQNMDNLEALPEWFTCFNNLTSLLLQNCPNLKHLPQAIGHLTSLEHLWIHDCVGLTERCRLVVGEDWPKIQHISQLEVK